MASRGKSRGARKNSRSTPRDPRLVVNLDSPSQATAPHPCPPQGAAPYPWPPQGQTTAANSTNPWGSYFNYLQQPQFPPLQIFGENSHFVGVASSVNPPSLAPVPSAKGTPAGRVNIDIDGDDGVEASRGVRKRFWSHGEEVRLASAWLNTSKDPIHGIDKKGDSFWGQIANKYNKDSQPDRVRDTNQLKVHWSRLSTTINEFNGYWSSVCKMNKSGYSDDQLMDEAQKLFTKKHSKPFAHVHWWRIPKNEPKWCTEKDRSKTIEIDDRCEPRPIGREAAKTEYKGKRKADQLMDGVGILGDKIDKIAEVAEECKKEREKVTEAQLEISRINLKVVERQEKVNLLQAYNSLLVQDTSNMTDEEKASRAKTIIWIQKKIMATDEEA